MDYRDGTPEIREPVYFDVSTDLRLSHYIIKMNNIIDNN